MNPLLLSKDTITGRYERGVALEGFCKEELMRIKNALWLVYGPTALEEKIVKVIQNQVRA